MNSRIKKFCMWILKKQYFGNALHLQGNYCNNLICRSEKGLKLEDKYCLKSHSAPIFMPKLSSQIFKIIANASKRVKHMRHCLLLGGKKMHLPEANLYLISHSVKVSCIPLQLHGSEALWSTWRVTPTGTNSVQTAPSMFIKLWLGFTQVGKVRKQQIENGPDCVKHKTPSVSQVRKELNQ